MKVTCNGGASFYGRYFKCWWLAEHRVHGSGGHLESDLSICDVFFYTLAEKLGIERIASTQTMFGLGQKNWCGPAAGSERRYAFGTVEDPQLQAKWYAGRDDLQ